MQRGASARARRILVAMNNLTCGQASPSRHRARSNPRFPSPSSSVRPGRPRLSRLLRGGSCRRGGGGRRDRRPPRPSQPVQRDGPQPQLLGSVDVPASRGTGARRSTPPPHRGRWSVSSSQTGSASASAVSRHRSNPAWGQVLPITRWLCAYPPVSSVAREVQQVDCSTPEVAELGAGVRIRSARWAGTAPGSCRGRRRRSPRRWDAPAAVVSARRGGQRPSPQPRARRSPRLQRGNRTSFSPIPVRVTRQ